MIFSYTSVVFFRKIYRDLRGGVLRGGASHLVNGLYHQLYMEYSHLWDYMGYVCM